MPGSLLGSWPSLESSAPRRWEASNMSAWRGGQAEGRQAASLMQCRRSDAPCCRCRRKRAALVDELYCATSSKLDAL
eukprot:8727858-Pyramimonas_sp.AAC.1